MKKASSAHKLAGIAQLKTKTVSTKKVSAVDHQTETKKHNGLSV